ncbi:hypothetical protein RN01_07055 [Cupriavidus sp. SHE]|uniref:Glycosyltransferase family 1 protein n=1 Tax=Cupriavidus metallidurans TaxID=119219 RepID=A0A482IMJ6_9BURK|nr:MULTISPECIES: glycosyltransferase family 1 protein [Cupriavidus]KWR84257.1 hypothetical protein RN01_07055 [Cupriavidus sp. SHE]QBP09998.1 glycosyltransferase family 1 protein [Cupriavidus metallidurans]
MNGPELLLDITRLMRRARHTTPTGIDRVEMAYADYLSRHANDRLVHTAMHPCGWHVRLPASAAHRFLEETARQWRGDKSKSRQAALRLWSVLCLTSPRFRWPAQVGRPGVYLLLSHTNLERPAAVARALATERARLACLVHDVIPLTHPEFARAGVAEVHRRRIETVDALADLVICNSQATTYAIGAQINRITRGARLLTAPLGVTPMMATAPPSTPQATAPYFVMLGTIEPRKNHLLLLQLWQRLVAQMGPARAPRLHLVGRSGWENAHILNLLERSSALHGVVTLSHGKSDREVAALLRGARALLMPSLAEGFGLPVAEALALGVPVIASDLPALREAGGGAPDYLDPLDGPAWLQAIRDYLDKDAPRRQAQLGRITAWRAPTWDDHCRVVLEAIDRLPATALRSREANLAI